MEKGSTTQEKWKQKVKVTTLVFAYHDFLLGCELGILLATLYAYIETLVETNHPKAFYAGIMISGVTASALGEALVTKFADKYRNVRLIFLVANILKILGNVTYTFHFSPWILLIGRVVAGFGSPYEPVVYGELARCYTKTELAPKIAFMGMSRALGMLVAPAANAMFTPLNVRIGYLRITFANVSGIYMALLYALALLLSALFIHNLSKEYVTKKGTEEGRGLLEGGDEVVLEMENDFEGLEEKDGVLEVHNRDNKPITTEKDINPPPTSDCEEEVSVIDVVKEIFTHVDTALLMLINFTETVISIGVNMMTSMLILDILKWPLIAINAVLFAAAACTIIPVIMLSILKPSDSTVYMLGATGVFGCALFQGIFIVLKVYNKNNTLNVILVVLMTMLQSSVLVVKNTFLSPLLARLVSLQIHPAADSVRFFLYKIGSIIAILSSPFLFQYIEYVGSVYVGIMLVLGLCIVIRGKTLQKPVINIYNIGAFLVL